MFSEEYKQTSQLICNGETHLDNLAEGYTEADKIIRDLPDVDAVEVVRCGQCRHATEDIIVEGVCYCHKIQQGMFVDGFCNYGERRSGNERHFMVDSYKY